MKKLVLAVSALALSAVSASAADLAARPYTKAPMMAPVYDWSGFYVGANGGWAQDNENWSFAATGIALGGHNSNGGVAGGQFGWRTQSGWLVWGLDFQGDWANLTGSNISSFNAAWTNSSKVGDFGIFAATAGYAVNNVLFYVKGGGAWTGNTFTSSLAGGAGLNTIAETRWGGALGAGLEYGVTQNWTVGVEYDHLFMGSVNDGFNFAGGGNITKRVSQDVDLVTARINYKFGGPVVARY